METGKQILTILQNTARETGTTVLITHNSAIAEMADRFELMMRKFAK